VIDQKELGYVEYFSYFSRMITHDARSTCEIKSVIVMEKGPFTKKKHPFYQQIGIKVMKETIEVLNSSHSQKEC